MKKTSALQYGVLGLVMAGFAFFGMPVNGQVTTPSKLESIGAGELRLDGKVTGLLGTGNWQLKASSWTSPRGINTELDEPKDKAVQATADVVVHAPGSSAKLSIKDIQLDSLISVIGKNGADGILEAREVILLGSPGSTLGIGIITLNAQVAEQLHQARAARDGGQTERALSLYHQALETAEGAVDKPGEALVLRDIGTVYSDSGQFEKAVDAYNRAFVASQARASEQASSYNGLGTSYLKQGRVFSAVKALEKAVDLSKDSDPIAKALFLENLALAYSKAEKSGDYLRAEQRLLPLQDAAGLQDSGTETLAALAMLSAQHNAHRARKYLGQTKARVSSVQDPRLRAHVENRMGLALEILGEKAEAKTDFEAALKDYEAAGDTKNADVLRSNLKSLEADAADDED